MSEVVDPSLEDRSSPRGRPLAATLGICTVHSATCIYRYADEYTPRRGRSCGSMVEKKRREPGNLRQDAGCSTNGNDRRLYAMEHIKPITREKILGTWYMLRIENGRPWMKKKRGTCRNNASAWRRIFYGRTVFENSFVFAVSTIRHVWILFLCEKRHSNRL